MVKYIPHTVTAIDTISTLREQEALQVSQLNLTINPLFRQRSSSPHPSIERIEHNQNLNMLIKTSSHFSVQDIAFIDEETSENSVCMVR